MHLIYKITNKINGKIYIGQKSYVGEPSMENYYGGGVEIKRAVKKYVRKRLSSSLKEFYKRTGRKPCTNTGKKWYNNGEKSGFFIEGEQPEGWVKGRIYKGESK